ncbi:MAG: Flp family type IVb pilin [Rhizobiaceae bacterium]|jgi:Flp pilus assembly pilin Flp|nr:Flp family type IVb pilin [Rhizobiaceae bacterium]
MLIRFLAGKKGSVATEYAILVGLMAVAIIGAVATLGDKSESMISTTADKVTTATKKAGK